MKKFFNKKNIIILSSILTLLVLIIVIFVLTFNSKGSGELYLYVSDGDLILYNKNTSEKTTLSYNVYDYDSDYEYYNESYFSILDNNTLVYASNISDYDDFTLNIVNLRNVFKGNTSSVIATNVESFTTSKNNVLYLNENGLYYYDNTSHHITDDAYNYAISEDGNTVFYTNENDNLYAKNLKTDVNTKINSNVSDYGLYVLGNEVIYSKTTTNDSLYDLYANDKKIASDIYGYTKEEDSIYFALLKDEDLNYYKSDSNSNLLIEINEEQFKTFMDDTHDEALLVLSSDEYSKQMLERVKNVALEENVRVYYVYIDNFSEEGETILKSDYYESLDITVPTLFNVYDNYIYDSLIGLKTEDEIYEFFDDNSLLDNGDEYTSVEEEDFSYYYYLLSRYQKGNIIEPKYKNGYLDRTNDWDSIYSIAYNVGGSSLEDASLDKITIDLFNNKNSNVISTNIKVSEIDGAYVIDHGNIFAIAKVDGDDYIYTLYDLRNNNLENSITGKNVCGATIADNKFFYVDECDNDSNLKIKGIDKIIDTDVSSLIKSKGKLNYLKNTRDDLFELYTLDGENKNLLLTDVGNYLDLESEIFYYANCYFDSYDDMYCDLIYIDDLGNKKVLETDIYGESAIFKLEF